VNSSLITADPKVMLGKPVIAGTRITVELVLEKIAAGESVQQILQSYPHLTREGILAAVEYALRVLRMDVVYPVSANAA